VTSLSRGSHVTKI